MQLSPSIPLSGIVKHYLLLTTENNIRLNYRLFADGNPGIVFHLGDPLIQYAGNHQAGNMQPASFAYGQISHYNDVMSTGKLGMLVVVLQPYSIYSLFRIAAFELNNCIIKLADFFGQEAMVLEDQVISTPGIHRKIAAIERFLLRRAEYINEPDHLLKESLQVIYQYRGDVTIEAVLKKVAVTERQLERKFRQYIGTSPKRYAEIIKFHHFLRLLQHCSGGKKISDVAYESGYYDQSHLNGHFKKITGVTPMQYKRDYQLLATNFMQLPENV